MTFSSDGELIAACTSHDNLLQIIRVSDGERVSTLQPSMSSKGHSSILDFSFAHPSFLCLLAKVASKEQLKHSKESTESYDLYVEVFDFNHDLMNVKKETINEKVSANP